MKIQVFGASGSGKSTLAADLANHLNCKHLESDNYYWKKTNPPYQEKTLVNERLQNLAQDFDRYENVVISGSLIDWGDKWLSGFDFGIFLFVPPEIRIQRLLDREKQRYGSALENDPVIKQTSKEFLDWAKQYDNPEFDGQSLHLHKTWMKKLQFPILTIDGNSSRSERMHTVLQYIEIQFKAQNI